MVENTEYFVMEDNFEDFADFVSEMEENHNLIEQTLLQSEGEIEQSEQLKIAMQALHTMKGSSNCYSIRPLVDMVHAVETLLQWVIKGQIEFNQNIIEIVLLCVDRVYKTTKDIANNAQSYVGDFDNIIEYIINLSEAPTEKQGQYISDLLMLLTNQGIDNTEKIESVESLTVPKKVDSTYADLQFFRSLAEEVDKRHNHWQGRTEYITRLALEMNQMAGAPVDSNQLEVAVYLHDMGMGFMPDELINKPDRLTPEEMAVLKNHPTIGYELIKRIDKWKDAAQYILDHQEYFDGSGYPNQKAGDEISDGAKIIAICDAFYAITHERPDRTSPRSFLRALAEINGCVDIQFCPKWTKIFNKVIQARAKKP